MSTSAPPNAETTRKHKNYDRELTDRERKLVEVWRDPKQRRNEVTALIWQREIIVYVGIVFGVVISSALILASVGARQGFWGHSPWTVLGELQSIVMLMYLIGVLSLQQWKGLRRQIVALKYISELEDRLASRESPAND